MHNEIKTYFLEEIAQVSHGFPFLLHGACRPNAYITGLNAPSFGSVFSWHAPLLFAL